jgi:hypothetical protein
VSKTLDPVLFSSIFTIPAGNFPAHLNFYCFHRKRDRCAQLWTFAALGHSRGGGE